MDSETAKEVAIQILRHELRIPSNQDIRSSSFFFADLGLDSDDVSFIFIPAIEKHFTIKLSFGEWEKIGSIDDLIKTLIERGIVSSPKN